MTKLSKSIYISQPIRPKLTVKLKHNILASSSLSGVTHKSVLLNRLRKTFVVLEDCLQKKSEEMVDREKSEQALGSIELIQSLKEDRISKLPDPLICQILSHLPVKDNVKTSVLSTRWRSLWLWVPRLALFSSDFSDFNALRSFGDRFFDSNRVSFIHKLDLGIENEDCVCLTSWIDAAIKRKIQHLGVYGSPESYCKMPTRLYTCKTLVSLKLFGVNLDDAEFVSLSCLKTMYLGFMTYPNEATFERLVSGCPVLEELIFSTCEEDPIVLRVHSQSLKRLTLGGSSFHSAAGVVIDAPLLSSLSISDFVLQSFVVNNLDSNTKLDISLLLNEWDTVESKRGTIFDLLPCISGVRDVTIRVDTFKLLCEYSKLEPLPRFGYMSSLSVTLDAFSLEWLPIFLRSCPNLKSLILGSIRGSKTLGLEEMERVSFSSVPECLVSSLEFVEFKNSALGYALEMKLVRYFLKNSAVLKKLSLRLGRLANHSRKDEIFEIPRGSTECEVVISEIPRGSIEYDFPNL